MQPAQLHTTCTASIQHGTQYSDVLIVEFRTNVQQPVHIGRAPARQQWEEHGCTIISYHTINTTCTTTVVLLLSPGPLWAYIAQSSIIGIFNVASTHSKLVTHKRNPRLAPVTTWSLCSPRQEGTARTDPDGPALSRAPSSSSRQPRFYCPGCKRRILSPRQQTHHQHAAKSRRHARRPQKVALSTGGYAVEQLPGGTSEAGRPSRGRECGQEYNQVSDCGSAVRLENMRRN